MPVNGEPLGRRILRWLAAHGFDDLVLNLHHQPATIAAVLGDGGDLGVRVRYSWEAAGARIGRRPASRARCSGRGARFLIVNGDTLTDVDLARCSRRTPRAARSSRWRSFRIRRREIRRRARCGRIRAGFTRAGIGASRFTSSASRWPRPRRSPGAGRRRRRRVGQLALSAADGERAARSIAAFVSTRTFDDIGTPADYLRTSLRAGRDEGGTAIGRDACRPTRVIGAGRSISLWDDVTSAPRAHLVDCIVADGRTIPAGAATSGVRHRPRLRPSCARRTSFCDRLGRDRFDQRPDDDNWTASSARERIDGYLDRSGLPARRRASCR